MGGYKHGSVNPVQGNNQVVGDGTDFVTNVNRVKNGEIRHRNAAKGRVSQSGVQIGVASFIDHDSFQLYSLDACTIDMRARRA